MIERNPLRKPKLHFDTEANPPHVTFDDGKEHRRNFPWMNYVEARCTHSEPDLLKVGIGDCLVIIRGHNLGLLFLAVERHTLMRVQAHPEFANDHEREIDTFVTDISFQKASTAMTATGRGQKEFDLGA